MTVKIAGATVAAALIAFAAGAAFDAPPDKPSFTQANFEQTLTGQPIVLPQGPVRVSFGVDSFPAGWKGPVHKQFYPRYAHILSGRLRVTYVDLNVVKEFGPGDTMIEGVDQWHWVESLGPDAAEIVVVDQAPPGQPAMVIKKP